MRLINTSSLEFEEFHGDAVPPYAILSHTWVEGEEISFREFIDPNLSTTTKSGFHKIKGACKIARQDGIDWIWIDTNCIDKASSAELTEAINSMYNWYKGSEVCYAYLSDVTDFPLRDGEDGPYDLNSQFRQSKWFLRGWTLQELIAPRRLVFYSSSWAKIGDRSDLASDISAVTGIETRLLRGVADIHAVSIAKKMSWAARRETTRVEDIAYCLLGLFDVNMPLLYGEGTKAFTRLQEEIIKTSNDHTVFCWSRTSVPADWTSMLAPSPAVFRDAGDYVPIDAWEIPMPHSMTNLGLSIYLPIVYTLTQMFVMLDAGLLGGRADMRACIAMERTNPRRSGSNILDRSSVFMGPTMLSKEATDTRERYNLFIRSRHVPQPESPLRPCGPRISKHGILLFVDPTATRLLSTGKRGAPLGSVGYDIETHPHGIFNEKTAVLWLPAFDGGSSLITSGLVRIRFKSPQETDLYLFLAVILTISGREAWYCGLYSADEFWFIEREIKERINEEVAPDEEMVMINGYLRTVAWEHGRKQLTDHTQDESLFVSIGGTMTRNPKTDIRAAMLSGKCESPYSFPMSAIDIGGVVDETDDDDSAEDEEFEDWDSSNEDEDSDESAGEKTNGSRRWDVNSSGESSQTLSSTSSWSKTSPPPKLPAS
ncbi:HET-domain-containing protein [Annulohypoxylon maeteangense]|uniref:HET-domain-containing protein n=1 Tax=Annulohypoxylon maeteangense TaxID=1927788 RepID=UPI0020080319|nr:HET-domain-containing protein [Annulohypoxylon maeteangense]KAI0888157.1 HET-domain-containing protein [Annulohypoxylon maeteangense]